MPDRSPRARRSPALLRASVGLHLLAAGLCLIRPRWWPWIAGGVVADHLLLVAGSLWPRSGLVGENLRRLPPWAEGQRAVALTFDDGPDPEVTPRVLDLLDERGARGTFFCIARHAASHPRIVAEIARRGHAVENHTFHHSPGFCFLGPRPLGRELDRAQAVLAEHAGSLPRWFRAPAGLRNPWLDSALAARGLHLASWTRRGFDTVSRDPEAVLRRLARRLAPRDVLLLHDRAPLRDAGADAVVLAVLPRLLDRLGHAGLRSVALPRA
jgi:peptidoglycan/xylan/chitin deacetylase (PgdA/CDA1 family)